MKSKLEELKKTLDETFLVKSKKYNFCFHPHYGNRVVYSVWAKGWSHERSCLITYDNGFMRIKDNQFGNYESGILLYEIRQDLNAHEAYLAKNVTFNINKQENNETKKL